MLDILHNDLNVSKLFEKNNTFFSSLFVKSVDRQIMRPHRMKKTSNYVLNFL